MRFSWAELPFLLYSGKIVPPFCSARLDQGTPIPDLLMWVGSEADDLSQSFSVSCFRVLFGFVYGILFDERIHARQSLAQLRSSAFSVHPVHHTKCTKNTQKHEKEIFVGWTP